MRRKAAIAQGSKGWYLAWLAYESTRMNIADLADKLATEHDLPKSKAKALVEATFAAVAEAVTEGEEVSIPSFGKFKVSDKAAREGRNPATGEAIQIAASRKATFTPAKQLKDKLNQAKG